MYPARSYLARLFKTANTLAEALTLPACDDTLSNIILLFERVTLLWYQQHPQPSWCEYVCFLVIRLMNESR